jgi:hypothetical protein
LHSGIGPTIRLLSVHPHEVEDNKKKALTLMSRFEKLLRPSGESSRARTSSMGNQQRKRVRTEDDELMEKASKKSSIREFIRSEGTTSGKNRLLPKQAIFDYDRAPEGDRTAPREKVERSFGTIYPEAGLNDVQKRLSKTLKDRKSQKGGSERAVTVSIEGRNLNA